MLCFVCAHLNEKNKNFVSKQITCFWSNRFAETVSRDVTIDLYIVFDLKCFRIQPCECNTNSQNDRFLAKSSKAMTMCSPIAGFYPNTTQLMFINGIVVTLPLYCFEQSPPLWPCQASKTSDSTVYVEKSLNCIPSDRFLLSLALIRSVIFCMSNIYSASDHTAVQANYAAT